jgi:hypothetical protein
MSNMSIWISLGSLIVGFITQAVNTGSLFGVVTVPQKWLPYASLLGTFLAGFIASIGSAASVTSTTLTQAVMAGLMALTGTAVGVTCHQHLKACPSNDNGEKKAA